MGANDRPVEESLKCFKAYDIRGDFPARINAPLARALGKACLPVFGAVSAVIGHDARLSSPDLSKALAEGLSEAGIAVTDLGLCGSEEIYYAAAKHPFDLGIMITGSHNPGNENGFKFVRGGAIPVSMQSGLGRLRDEVGKILDSRAQATDAMQNHAAIRRATFRREYIDWMLEYTGLRNLRPAPGLRILANAGNGCAGLVLQELAPYLPCEVVPLHFTPDGNFPNGVPNPLLPERRSETAQAVLAAKAELGVAFDGDFDRCFFYDSKGNFIEGYYIVGMLAKAMLAANPGQKIVHDTRVYWNTRECALEASGIPVMGKTGHAYMKERMRQENAIYGGEMSAHHYFRDFAFCDSGILTMFFMLSLLIKSGQPLEKLVQSMACAFPCSGEINFRVRDTGEAIAAVEKKYAGRAIYSDMIDGLNLEFAKWRFNLRPSNTEPLLRLNAESRADTALLHARTQELCEIIKEFCVE